MHFDHERIPERIVHARGTGAYGYFKVNDDRASKYTYAPVLTDSSRKTPVFVRFSTVQGSRGSAVRFVLYNTFHADSRCLLS
jgi:catalase